MIQSMPLLSHIGEPARFSMEQEQANCDPSHGPALLTLSSQNFFPEFSSESRSHTESGGPSSCRAGLDFCNTGAEAEMISVDWESPIVVRQGIPARNWLSMGNGMDKSTDREFIKPRNSEESAQNSPASFESELSVNLSMGSRPSNGESEPGTGSQQAHNFTASYPNGTEIDRPSGIYNPVLSSTEFAVQRSAATEPWINPFYRLKEVPDQKLWMPIKKMARKNSMTAVATCKNSTEEANTARNGAATRTCVDCYTTRTPLWRTGPRGPKSLCNACGIRYRKTRRAALSECNAGCPKRKTEENFIHFKKRSRVSMASCKKNIGLENHPVFQRAFAREEEEAAVLLMALSCGLVHG